MAGLREARDDLQTARVAQGGGAPVPRVIATETQKEMDGRHEAV